MGNKKANITDPQLDRLMGLYETPELDGPSFDQKLFSRLGQEGQGPAGTDNHRFVIWSLPRRFAALAVVVLFSAALVFSNYDFDQQPAPTQTQTASASGGAEKTSVASAENDITDVDGFLNEIIDQDIAVLEYSVAMNTQPEKQSEKASSEDDQAPPPIDSFLDELLGIESRTL
ncbi:MAG: hypothetical protein ACQEQL_05115 [Pseudomonadota bacterium]